MNRFCKALSHLNSTQIDEKIEVLNKELEKTGSLSEQPENSIGSLYEYNPPVEPVHHKIFDAPKKIKRINSSLTGNSFCKVMSHLNSNQIDEKIKFLDKQLKKTRTVLESGPTMGTGNVYQTFRFDHTPFKPLEYSDVPDPNGVRSDGWVQPSNGYDADDPDTWDDAYNDFSWLYNSDDVGGETDRPVVKSVTPNWDGATAGGGMFSAIVGHGQSLGYISNDGVYQPLVTSNLFGNMIPPVVNGSPLAGDHYYGIPDAKWAQMQALYAQYEEGNNTTTAVKMWYPWSYFWYGSWESYGGTKKGGDGSTRLVLINGSVFTTAERYVSQEKELAKSSTTILTQRSLDDPSVYPGNPNRFMDFLRGALDVGEKAFDWLTDKAGESGDNLRQIGDDIDKGIKDAIEDVSNLLNDTSRKVADKFAQITSSKSGAIAGVIMAAASDVRGYIKTQTQGGESEVWARGGDFPSISNTTSETAYTANLAMSLTKSVGTGKMVMVDNTNLDPKIVASKVTKKDIDMMLEASGITNASDLSSKLPSVDTSVDSILNPNKDGEVKKTYFGGQGFGGEGGSIMQPYMDPKTGEIRVLNTGDKVVRIGGESGEKFDLMTQTFTDVPAAGGVIDKVKSAVESGQVASLVSKLVLDGEIDEAAVQETTKMLLNDPSYQAILATLDSPAGDYLKGGAKGFTNGGVAGAVLYGKLKTALGLRSKTDLEKAGGHGHVRRQTNFSVNDMKPEVRDYLLQKLGMTNVKESYLSEGWESPKYTYVDKDQQKRWFKEKDVAPVYPKKAPPKMVKGWHPKFVVKLEKPIPVIKVSKKDLERSHTFKPDEVEELMQLVKNLNDYIKRNPDHLAYARVRYPKHDPRLAALNYKLDMQLAAADEYIETRFPENERLFDRLMKRTKESIKLTDPKTYENNNGKLITFNKLARVDDNYQPRKIKLKKKPKMSQGKLFLLPDRKKKDDILKDKMAVLDKEIQKTMPDA